MSNSSRTWLRFSSGELTAEVDPHGAQLSTLQDRSGRDLLWNGDPSFWTGRAPLLFPIVGALADGAYHLAGRTYPLSRHGFARDGEFEVAAAGSSNAVLRLRADASSGLRYPFRFELEVHFELLGTSLTVVSRIRNHGDEPMPASFGYHPAFRWPLPYGRERARHFIEFAQDEPAPVRRLDKAGLLTADLHATPVVGRRLALTDGLFENDALIFDSIRSRHVTYGADSGPRLRVSFPNSPFLGIWSKPGAPFVCIEPWNGLADPVAYSGDFTAKPGVFLVPARSATAIRMDIALLDGEIAITGE